jgi:Na+/H+-dicarboxylate symporter
MQFKLAHATHPLLLLLCAAAGILLGQAPATWSHAAVVVVEVSTALFNLVCLPLLVVSTLTGLRHVLGMPLPGRRLMVVALAAVGLLLTGALAGTLVAAWSQIGWQLDASSQVALGQVVMQGGGHEAMQLHPAPAPANTGINAGAYLAWLPNNAFFALASGELAAVMFCTVFFGLAFTAQSSALSVSAQALLEAVSRTLEKLISILNLAVPVLVLACAAQLTRQWDEAFMRAMSGFLVGFGAVTIVLCAASVLTLAKLGALPLRQVWQALHMPALLSLVSVSPLAAVPSSVEGMSNRLGFSRGIVEMLMPASMVFLRTGAALQLAMLTVFVSHMYGQHITPLQMMTLVPVAVVAALASSGNSGLANLSFTAWVVAQLKLPFEAALPLFAAIQLFSEGPARLLSLLSSCVLTAFVCGGLPMEKQNLSRPAAFKPPLSLGLSRSSASLLVSCVLLAGLLSMVLGVALGLRKASPAEFKAPPAGQVGQIYQVPAPRPTLASACCFLSSSPATSAGMA